MEKAMESFMKFQREADERHQKFVEEQWKKELELDEKRRHEDKEHELRIMEMLGQMFNRPAYYNSGHYDDY